MATAMLTLVGSKTGLPSGTEYIGPLTIVNTAAVDAASTLALVSGNNTITVPTGISTAVIIPTAGNTVALTMKGASGDTGMGMSPTNPTAFSLAAAQTTFILNSGGSQTVTIQWV